MAFLANCLPSLFAKEPSSEDKIRQQSTDIIQVLLTAEKPGQGLVHDLNQIVHSTGWTERLTSAVLNRLVDAIKTGAKMATAMKDAMEKAIQAATDFAKEHPVFVTIIALGILVELTPWAIGALGFGELGPIEGKHHLKPALLKEANNKCFQEPSPQHGRHDTLDMCQRDHSSHSFSAWA